MHAFVFIGFILRTDMVIVNHDVAIIDLIVGANN